MDAPLPLRRLDDGTWRLDCRGLLCPVPLVRAGQAIRRIGLGDLLEVLADDPGAGLDLKDWCGANRQEWLGEEAYAGVSTTRIRRSR